MILLNLDFTLLDTYRHQEGKGFNFYRQDHVIRLKENHSLGTLASDIEEHLMEMTEHLIYFCYSYQLSVMIVLQTNA